MQKAELSEKAKEARREVPQAMEKGKSGKIPGERKKVLGAAGSPTGGEADQPVKY